MSENIITIKLVHSNSTFWERHPDHPTGEIYISGNETAQAAMTRAVKQALGNGQIEVVDTSIETEAEPVAISAEFFDEPVAPEPDDLTVLDGLGPSTAKKLAQRGVTTFEELAAASADDLKGVGASAETISAWIETAQEMGA